jgi:two-component system nitrate/nitrite response regulator NarL
VDSDVVAQAARIRKIFPASKITLLFGIMCASQVPELFDSEFDGCIPLFVSAENFIGTLDSIVRENARVIVMARSSQTGASIPYIKDVLSAHSTENSLASLAGLPAISSVQLAAPVTEEADLRNDGQQTIPRLSAREVEILDGLMKGYCNKAIARERALTEATVKVHIKSILRKIRVANRTQAAVWALANGYLPNIANLDSKEPIRLIAS